MSRDAPSPAAGKAPLGWCERRVLRGLRPRLQHAWRHANGRANRQLLRLIDDDKEALATNGGTVVFDLHACPAAWLPPPSAAKSRTDREMAR